MSFVFTPVRSLAAFAVLIIGIALFLMVRDFWPAIFENTRIALLIGFGGAALLILNGAFQARARTYVGLAVMAAFISACVLCLVEPFLTAKATVGTFIKWQQAGQSLIASFRAAMSIFSSYTELQKQALYTSLAIGLPIPLALLIKQLDGVVFAHNNRVSNFGPWRAQWLSKREIMQLRHNAKGLPLGLHKGAILRYRPNANQGWREGHHAAIAGTRAGKGVSVVIPAIIDHGGSVVALDIKGELFSATANHRRSLGRRVIVLNPFGVHQKMQDRFNPLDYIRTNHLVRDIDVLAEGLVRPEQGNGSHFAEMAKSVVAAVLEVTKTQHEKADLITVMDILFSSSFNKTLQSWADDPATFGPRVSQTAATFLSAGENEQGAIKTTIKKAFDWARSNEMRDFLGQTNFTLEDVFNDKADVYIVVPLDQIDAQSVFLRLITNIILGLAVRQERRVKSKKNVLLVLDEFVRLGRMEKIVNIANVAAGAGIEALFVTQDKGQIESVYGKGDTASILGSCVTIRIFGLGRAEIETAKWASDALGHQTVMTKTTQSAKRFGERAATNTIEQRQKMMTPDQILEMPSGEMLLLTGSKRPLKLKAIVSHEHPSYSQKLRCN